jgi:DNA primase
VADKLATLIWVVNLGCLDLNPWPIRCTDVDRPDELRVDLDPGPETPWSAVKEVALLAREVLRENGLEGFPKTSGSRGIHILVRIEPKWGFREVRTAALAMARAIEQRAPGLATTAWWKEERPPAAVFVDYNQNARDRTVASAYSVRPRDDGRVSAPITWAEVPDVEPAAFTVLTMPARYAKIGDPHAKIDEHYGSLDQLLKLAKEQEAAGMQDGAYPPHFPKGENEPPRVQPSRRRMK